MNTNKSTTAAATLAICILIIEHQASAQYTASQSTGNARATKASATETNQEAAPAIFATEIPPGFSVSEAAA